MTTVTAQIAAQALIDHPRMAAVIANRGFYAIQLNGCDVWMNAGGNLGSLLLSNIFHDADEAQRWLDGRRLRAGFRPRLNVVPVTEGKVREMAEECRLYAGAVIISDDDRQEWADRAAELETMLNGGL